MMYAGIRTRPVGRLEPGTCLEGLATASAASERLRSSIIGAPTGSGSEAARASAAGWGLGSYACSGIRQQPPHRDAA